jgi:hypothetical protein
VNALQDLQNGQDSFSAAQAQLVAATASLKLAKLNLSYTKVVAHSCEPAERAICVLFKIASWPLLGRPRGPVCSSLPRHFWQITWS